MPTPAAVRTEIESGPLAFAPLNLTRDEIVSGFASVLKQLEAAAFQAHCNRIIDPNDPVPEAVFTRLVEKIKAVTAERDRMLANLG